MYEHSKINEINNIYIMYEKRELTRYTKSELTSRYGGNRVKIINKVSIVLLIAVWPLALLLPDWAFRENNWIENIEALILLGGFVMTVKWSMSGASLYAVALAECGGIIFSGTGS